MKAYKFTAQHKPLDKKAPWRKFGKYLYLTPEEVALAKEDAPQFYVEQVAKGQLPRGYYEEPHLSEWKSKTKKRKEKIS